MSTAAGLLRLSRNSILFRSRLEDVRFLVDPVSRDELIVARGHMLQLDAPDLGLERQIMYLDRSEEEFLERVELHIAALNKALVNIPREKVRLHLCWGNWEGPHCDDIDLGAGIKLINQYLPVTGKPRGICRME